MQRDTKQTMAGAILGFLEQSIVKHKGGLPLVERETVVRLNQFVPGVNLDFDALRADEHADTQRFQTASVPKKGAAAGKGFSLETAAPQQKLTRQMSRLLDRQDADAAPPVPNDKRSFFRTWVRAEPAE